MRYLLIMFAVLLLGCEETQTELHNYYYRGLINQEFVGHLKTLPDVPVNLYLGSHGGESDIGLEAAKIITQKKVNLIIDGEFGICASGCAEFILPAADSVSLINEPLIGYHQNPQIIYHIISERTDRDLEFCTFIKNEVELTEVLLNQSGLNKEFWKETFERILLVDSKLFYYEEKCPGLRRKFYHELWFPTSTQLKTKLGLEFTGMLCADDPRCYESRIDQRWTKGTHFIAGDTSYTSKGQ